MKPLYWARVPAGSCTAASRGRSSRAASCSARPDPAAIARLPHAAVRPPAAQRLRRHQQARRRASSSSGRRRRPYVEPLGAPTTRAPNRSSAAEALEELRRADERGHPPAADRRRAARRLPLRRHRLQPRRVLHGGALEPRADVLDRLPVEGFTEGRYASRRGVDLRHHARRTSSSSPTGARRRSRALRGRAVRGLLRHPHLPALAR